MGQPPSVCFLLPTPLLLSRCSLALTSVPSFLLLLLCADVSPCCCLPTSCTLGNTSSALIRLSSLCFRAEAMLSTLDNAEETGELALSDVDGDELMGDGDGEDGEEEAIAAKTRECTQCPTQLLLLAARGTCRHNSAHNCHQQHAPPATCTSLFPVGFICCCHAAHPTHLQLLPQTASGPARPSRTEGPLRVSRAQRGQRQGVHWQLH